MRRRQTCLAFLVLLLGCGMVAQADVADGLRGLWEFDNAGDLTAATVGNDLVLAGDMTQTAIAGVDAGDGAVSIGVGSHYECYAGIPANGGGSYVNQYTLLFDFRYPSSSAGQYMCFFQTDTSNSNDGDYFISPSENWGVASITYAQNPGGMFSVPDTWYRVILSVDQGSGSQFFRLYIDGVLIHEHGNSGTDGRHSLYPDPEVSMLLFADENGEDPEIHCSTVGIWDRALTEEEIAGLGGPEDTLVSFGTASAPTPEDGVTDVPLDAVLAWTPGESAVSHDVYLGTAFDDVNDAGRDNPMDVLMSQGQADAAFDADGLLDFGQTYYWRIDEVNGAPDNTIFTGDVWSFTTEPFAYAVENIVATSNTTSDEDQGPENTVNGSGLDEADQHSTVTGDMWIGTPVEGETPYLQFAFDDVYKLHEMLVWNYNMEFEMALGLGVKDATVEYSENGTDWTVLGDVVLNQGPGTATYAANTTVPLEGVAAQYVRLTINSSYTSTTMHGLSEVRFTYIPVNAREPQPADGAADVPLETVLSWRSGREAVSHEVYLGTDPDALTLAATTTEPSYAATLDLGATYSWQIVEVNDAEAVSAWAGPMWTFTTEEYIVIDDFDDYVDVVEDGDVIWEVWIDGYVEFGGDPENGGGVVGHDTSPFAEQTIVRSGQSMPLYYNNANASAISEADRTVSPAQDWSVGGIESLSLWFHGVAGDTGQLYVKINGAEILYGGAAGDIAVETWIPWTIDLTTAGVDVSNVTELSVGVKGTGAGVVYIDDIRLYPSAPEMIEPIAPDDGDAGLLGLWKLDDGAGTVATDSSGNGHDGVFNGEPQWATGVAGGALQLDGADDYVVLDTIDYGEADLSVALWVKTDGWNEDAAIISNKDWNSGGNVGWAIAGGAGNNGSFQWNFSDGSGRADFDPSVSLCRISGGRWHHLCVTHDRDGLAKFYCDGMLIGQTDISALSGSLDAGLPTVLGTDGAEGTVWAYWFAGAFDDVRIFNRVLSHGEVAGLTGRTAPLYQGL